MVHTIVATNAGVVTTMAVQIERIRWTGNIANSQTCLVQDNLGRVIFQGNATKVNDIIEEDFKRPIPFQGINVIQIDSGTLVFFYR